MTKTQQTSEVSTAADADPIPPRGLSKAEKGEFRRVCDMRRHAGKPVRPIECDLLVDYVQTRARLAIWQKKLRHGQTIERDSFSYSRDERMNLPEQLSLAAAVDRTAAACRRLARDLRLIGD